MTKPSRLSQKKQKLVTEYLQLVKILARYFLQQRAHWQRQLYLEDLEGEGYLALTKAARTYDPSRLPYPKAYFARAILNSMLKYIKRATRMPGDDKLSLTEAAELAPVYDSPDYLGMAIADLPEEFRELAADRFQNGMTLRSIAEGHDLSLRSASVRCRAVAKTLAGSLDIQLGKIGKDRECRVRGNSRRTASGKRASESRPDKRRGRSD